MTTAETRVLVMEMMWGRVVVSTSRVPERSLLRVPSMALVRSRPARAPFRSSLSTREL